MEGERVSGFDGVGGRLHGVFAARYAVLGEVAQVDVEGSARGLSAMGLIAGAQTHLPLLAVRAQVAVSVELVRQRAGWFGAGLLVRQVVREARGAVDLFDLGAVELPVIGWDFAVTRLGDADNRLVTVEVVERGRVAVLGAEDRSQVTG